MGPRKVVAKLLVYPSLVRTFSPLASSVIVVSDGCLRNASSFVIDRRVRQAAVLLGDDKLVAKLSGGDMPAIEAKYHPICLCKLYSRAAYLQKSGSNINKHTVTYEIVLLETIDFIRKELKKSETAPVFMLGELKQMFISVYHRYTGTDIELHSTRFKEQLLSQIPGLQAHKRGMQIVLTSDDAATEAILAALSYSGDQNGLHLVQAAKLVRQYLFDGEASLSGNFVKDCQKGSVPKSLLMLVQMTLEGTSLSLAADNQNNNIALQLSQLIKFNALML